MVILRDIVLSAFPEYPRRKDFNLGTNCVSSLFLYELGKIETSGIKKIIVQVCDYETKRIEMMDDVCRVSLTYDFDLHWKLSRVERKRLMLTKLVEGVLVVCDEFQIDKQHVIETFERLVITDLHYCRKWGKPIRSPDRKRYAQVKYIYDIDLVTISVFTWHKGEEQQALENKLVSTMPHEIKFVPLLGKLAWRDDKTICLHPKKRGLDDICVNV